MTNLVKTIEKFWEYGSGHIAFAAFGAHSLSISIGICQGYSAILIPQLNSTVSAEESSWLASLGAISNPIGSILSGLLAEYFGRRRSIQLSTLPFLIGWLCIGFAPHIDYLYAGRLITGIAAGMSSACYTYVSEVSTPQTRGFFQALGPICASFGIFITYVLGYFLPWDHVALISCAFGVLTLVLAHFLPESPLYLLKTGRKRQAFESYVWFRRNNNVAQEEIDRYDLMAKQTEADAGSNVYFAPQTIKPFFILIALFFLQELAGIYTVLFYAVTFFQETGLQLDNYISSIIVGFIRLFMSIVTAILINKFGRRVLCKVSSAGMALTILPMVVFFKYYEYHAGETRIMSQLPLVCVILNVLFSMIGMLPIPWILVGELFPLQVRSIMSGFVICIAQLFIFLCVKIYPNLIEWLGFSGTLASFCVASCGAFVFVQFGLPETKNRTLDEIEEYFKSGAKMSKVDGVDNKGFRPETVEWNYKHKSEFCVV